MPKDEYRTGVRQGHVEGLDALARHGFGLRGKLSAPISRVPRRAPPEKPKADA